MKRLQAVMSVLFGAPNTMTPEEIAERVGVLEMKVEANKVALEEHERTLHPDSRADEP